MGNIKNPIFLFFVTVLIFSSCKSNQSQQRTDNNLSEKAFAAPTPETELNPGQAIVHFKVIHTKKNEVTALFSTLEKQSFGFNTYLISGDSITITTKKEMTLPPGNSYRWVVEESKMLGSKRKTFRLINELN
jgi:hypothetical protein